MEKNKTIESAFPEECFLRNKSVGAALEFAPLKREEGMGKGRKKGRQKEKKGRNAHPGYLFSQPFLGC